MLIGLMILAIGIVGVTALTLLYDVAMTQNRGRLTETVKSQACLIEAVARHDMAYKPHLPGGPIHAIVARITDMTMPNMSGKQLAAEVKKTRPDFPVIICSGFSDLIDEEKAKELGVQGFLMKPLDRDVLARTIRKVLDASK